EAFVYTCDLREVRRTEILRFGDPVGLGRFGDAGPLAECFVLLVPSLGIQEASQCEAVISHLLLDHADPVERIPQVTSPCVAEERIQLVLGIAFRNLKPNSFHLQGLCVPPPLPVQETKTQQGHVCRLSRSPRRSTKNCSASLLVRCSQQGGEIGVFP